VNKGLAATDRTGNEGRKDVNEHTENQILWKKQKDVT
jgi:hypothetical protein